MKCPYCGSDNAPAARFCEKCGTPLGTKPCPHCGHENQTTARFCVHCGGALNIEQAPAVPSVPTGGTKRRTPGWVWGMGLLVGVIVLGGLILGGILPLNLSSFARSAPAPTGTPFASSESSTVAGYCPESGGVILFWNSDYNCINTTGDAGYRQRIGDGAQDVNTGHFDDQATSLQIPQGWSVLLWENAGLTGGHVCYNTSVRDFTPLGNFPETGTPINDNISSMEVFRDGTCGEDLAAGAEPAPWPKDVGTGGAQPNAAAGPGAQPNATECTDQTPCACLPAELQEFPIDENGFVDGVEFLNRYIDNIRIQDEKIEIDLKDFDGIFDKLAASPLRIDIGGHYKEPGAPQLSFPVADADCKSNGEDPALVTCSINAPEGLTFSNDAGKLQLDIFYESENVWTECMVARYDQPIFGLQPSASQCVSPNSVVCGSQCCGDKESCVVKKGRLVCEGTGDESEEGPSEPLCDQSYCPP
jgi:hypothetical protein